jgi:hypothetical protein
MLMATHLVGFGSAATGYNVPFSGDWERGDSDDMTITFGGAGNRRTWTFSDWIRLESNGQRMGMIGGDDASPDYLEITSSNTLQFYLANGATINVQSTNTLSVGTWYHVVLRFDTTQATEANRIRIYLGTLGTQATEVTYNSPTYPTQNSEWDIGDAATLRLGNESLTGVGGGTHYFDGLMAETAYVNGQSLGPESFASGGRPIDLSSLSFGTNGFWLKYANSGALGTDSSGNGNTFTNSGVTQSTTTPTN